MNPTNTRSAIAAEARAALARKGQSAAWLAEDAGISKAALSRKLRGEVSFTVEELVLVAEALAVEPDALLPRSVQYATTDRPAPKEAS